MAFELRELQGNAFNNKHKKSDNHPDMRGELLVNGVPHEIAIWHKSGTKGPFIGFTISEKRQRDEAPQQSISQRAQAQVRRPHNADMDDDIPFAPEFR